MKYPSVSEIELNFVPLIIILTSKSKSLFSRSKIFLFTIPCEVFLEKEKLKSNIIFRTKNFIIKKFLEN